MKALHQLRDGTDEYSMAGSTCAPFTVANAFLTFVQIYMWYEEARQIKAMIVCLSSLALSTACSCSPLPHNKVWRHHCQHSIRAAVIGAPRPTERVALANAFSRTRSARCAGAFISRPFTGCIAAPRERRRPAGVPASLAF
eukprot:366545-Chlamydomonas_euryale.AAC.13